VTRLLGFAPSDLIGKPIHGLIHADGSPYPADECPILKTCSEGSLHHGSNELLWKMDGTTLDCEYTSTPVRKGGELIGAVFTVRDISARLQQEEHAERARNAADAKAAIAKVMQEARPLKERLNTALELLFSMSGTDGPNRGGVFLTHPETQNLELFCARGDFSEDDPEDESSSASDRHASTLAATARPSSRARTSRRIPIRLTLQAVPSAGVTSLPSCKRRAAWG
jgi:PAS domain S-box-containing protein